MLGCDTSTHASSRTRRAIQRRMERAKGHLSQAGEHEGQLQTAGVLYRRRAKSLDQQSPRSVRVYGGLHAPSSHPMLSRGQAYIRSRQYATRKHRVSQRAPTSKAQLVEAHNVKYLEAYSKIQASLSHGHIHVPLIARPRSKTDQKQG